MRTSELAGRAGVNPETLRYYERRGLLTTPPRTGAGYRDSPTTALELLRFVKRAQELGFTLDEVEELVHLDSGGPDSCDAARLLAEHRRADLERRIRDLQRTHDSLADLVTTCDLPRADGSCALLEAIDDRPGGGDPMNLEVLHVPDCPNLDAMLKRLAEAADLPVSTRVIASEADAIRFGMAGSPTLLIDGIDPFSAPGQGDCGLSCRLYRDVDGRIVPAPSVQQLREAITSAAPTEILSAWRTRAVPLGQVEKRVHQQVLRTFATTGHPPAASDLEALVESGRREITDVLASLHEIDAIRLGPDGRIMVAYPFSATPTLHRVRIAAQVEVYAMCAIDALGISAMLGMDTSIESVDVTTRQPIAVTTTAGRTTWTPGQAVVFVGAAAGGGPSADCCCDYLNFFADRAAADAWSSSHPQIPGQVLDQRQAEDLSARLFQPLLAG